MTASARLLLRRRRLLVGSCALWATPLGCDDADALDTELWASAQGGEDGSYALVVAGPGGVHSRFASAVRGHGLATHPDAPHRVVMFGRRPQRVAMVADLRTGQARQIETPAGRHQVGHGCFSADGRRLMIAEADDVTGEGTIAVHDAASLERVAEFDSFGVGPHQIALMPSGDTLVVANGGLITAPGGRDPINLDTMQSSLVYINVDAGTLRSEHRVPEAKASLRHLDVADDGTVVVVMQVQRDALPDADPRPLIAVHAPGGELTVLDEGLDVATAMEDYAGSVAVDSASRVAAVTSPRGNVVAFWHLDTGRLEWVERFDDVSGVAVAPDGSSFVLSGSGGQLRRVDTVTLAELPDARVQFPDVRWDNHLLTLF